MSAGTIKGDPPLLWRVVREDGTRVYSMDRPDIPKTAKRPPRIVYAPRQVAEHFTYEWTKVCGKAATVTVYPGGGMSVQYVEDK